MTSKKRSRSRLPTTSLEKKRYTTDVVFYVHYIGWPSLCVNILYYLAAIFILLTFSWGDKDLFWDVELVLCSSGPVLHTSPALHGEIDITGNC